MKTYNTQLGAVTAAELNELLNTPEEQLTWENEVLRKAILFVMDFNAADDEQGAELAKRVQDLYDRMAAEQHNAKLSDFSD